MKIVLSLILMVVSLKIYSQELRLSCFKFNDRLFSNVQYNSSKNCFIYWGGEKPLTRRPIKIKFAESELETVIDSSSLSPSGWINESEIVYRTGRVNPSRKIPLRIKNVFTNEIRSIARIDSLSPLTFKVFDNSISFLIKRGRVEEINRWDDLTNSLIEYELDDKNLTHELVFYRKLNLMIYACIDGGISVLKGHSPDTKTTSVYDQSYASIEHLKVDTANYRLYYIKSKTFNYSDEVCVVDLRSGRQKSLGFLPKGKRVRELDVLGDKLLLSINDENSTEETVDFKNVSLTLKVNPSVCTIELK